MRNLIQGFKEYRYKKRLKKWVAVNLRAFTRRTLRVLSQAIRRTPLRVALAGVCVLALVIAGMLLFGRFVSPRLDRGRAVVRRLSMTEYDEGVPYLRTLAALGSTNRIQVSLRTEDEDYLRRNGVSLRRGGVNLLLRFSDGTTTEYSLRNRRYQTFGAGAEDTFTLILPFGYTPFDVTEYTIHVLPDRRNRYDSWHCRWARVYFLLGDEPVLLARESWDGTAVFGAGDDMITSSTLNIAHTENRRYARCRTVFGDLMRLSGGAMNASLKADALDSLGLNAAGSMFVEVETVNIEMQNDLLTYYAKGVSIPETDSLDYDGRMFLDVTFYSALPDGGYTKSFLLDTLGTDDFELGTTGVFKLELPDGMCVFDISDMSLRVENPYDAWAPHLVRVYVKPDYCDRLEIARITDTLLRGTYSTSVFYKNLIDGAVPFDLSAKFALSGSVRRALEQDTNTLLVEMTEPGDPHAEQLVRQWVEEYVHIP